MTARRTRAALVLAMAIAATSCASGQSILETGGVTVPTVPDSSESGGEATTAPTTTAVPEAELPPCPVSALAAATAPVEVTFWHAMNSQLQISLTALTDQYNASQTKVHVSLINQNGYEQVIEKYKAASPADRPAVVQLPDYTLQLVADSGTVIPVQSCINAEQYDLSDFLPRAVAYYTLRSALQGMPFNISNPVLYYNRADFVQAGLDPDKPPVSLEDLRAVSQKIVDSGAAKYGIALDHSLDAGGGWYLEQWLAKAGKLYSNNENGRAAPSTNVLFNGTTGVELLTFLQDMVRDGLAIDVGPLTSGFDNLLKLADPKEPAAMTIATAAALAAVLNVLSGGGVQGISNADLGIGQMPGPTVNPGTLVGGAALWLPVGKSDLETAAAWDYVKFLVGAQQQADWTATTGYVPVRESSVNLSPLKEKYTTDPRFKVAYDQLLAAADTPVQAGPVLGPQREVRVITSNAIAAVLTQGADVKQTLDAAARQSDLLIAQWTKVEGSWRQRQATAAKEGARSFVAAVVALLAIRAATNRAERR